MELKIRIKEISSIVRGLTIEEQCIYLAYLDTSNPDNLRLAALKKLDDLHLVEIIPSNDITNIGTFRTETIRDATPGEVMAWHVLQSVNACDVLTCEKCITNGSICICDMMIYDDSYELLKGKEVILEVVE